VAWNGRQRQPDNAKREGFWMSKQILIVLSGRIEAK
jgi:hypothetical protein